MSVSDVKRPMEEYKKRLRERVLSSLDLSRQYDDEDILSLIRDAICTESGPMLSVADRIRTEKEIFDSIRKLDVLQELLEDEDITEIMINGPDNIFVEKAGRIIKSDRHFISPDKLDDIIQQIVAENNQVVNESRPIVDTRLPDGSRVNIVLPPIAVDYSIVSIRRFPKETMTMERLLSYGSLTEEMAEVLKKLVQSGYNIFISGSTGSGKTSLINALSGYIPKDERLITIEDAAELQIRGIPNLVRLESRDATLEGKLAVPIRELLKSALRMRPDRIIVGECRGAEAVEMLMANNTGHAGSMSSGHANSAKDMISRLETMVLMGMDLPLLAIRKQIASGIDIFVHVGRQPDRSRKIEEIAEVIGMKDGEVELRTIYSFKGETGSWEKENEILHTEKLVRHGFSV